MKTIELLHATGEMKKGEIRTVMSLLADLLVARNLARYYCQEKKAKPPARRARRKRS